MITPLDQFSQACLPAIEAELRRAVAPAGGPDLEELHSMLAYHLGWEGQGAGANASGKRIRPLLVLLSCAAAGGDWQAALPAAGPGTCSRRQMPLVKCFHCLLTTNN